VVDGVFTYGAITAGAGPANKVVKVSVNGKEMK